MTFKSLVQRITTLRIYAASQLPSLVCKSLEQLQVTKKTISNAYLAAMHDPVLCGRTRKVTRGVPLLVKGLWPGPVVSLGSAPSAPQRAPTLARQLVLPLQHRMTLWYIGRSCRTWQSCNCNNQILKYISATVALRLLRMSILALKSLLANKPPLGRLA